MAQSVPNTINIRTKGSALPSPDVFGVESSTRSSSLSGASARSQQPTPTSSDTFTPTRVPTPVFLSERRKRSPLTVVTGSVRMEMMKPTRTITVPNEEARVPPARKLLLNVADKAARRKAVVTEARAPAPEGHTVEDNKENRDPRLGAAGTSDHALPMVRHGVADAPKPRAHPLEILFDHRDQTPAPNPAPNPRPPVHHLAARAQARQHATTRASQATSSPVQNLGGVLKGATVASPSVLSPRAVPSPRRIVPRTSRKQRIQMTKPGAYNRARGVRPALSIVIPATPTLDKLSTSGTNFKATALRDLRASIKDLGNGDDTSLHYFATNLRHLTRLIDNPPNLSLFPREKADAMLAELEAEYNKARFKISNIGRRGLKTFDTTGRVDARDMIKDKLTETEEIKKCLAYMDKLLECARWVQEQRRKSIAAERQTIANMVDLRNSAALGLVLALYPKAPRLNAGLAC